MILTLPLLQLLAICKQVKCLFSFFTQHAVLQIITLTKDLTLLLCQKLADNTSVEEEFKLSRLLLVYVAVSLPTLALDPNSLYSQEHGGA